MTRLQRLLSATALLAATIACSNPEATAKKHVASGDAYLAKDQLAEALLEYRAAVQAAPRSPSARTKLAEAHLKNNNLAGAFSEYIRAADLVPEDNALQLKAGEFLILGRRFDEAKARAEAVLARDPKNAQASIIKGNALAGLKKLDEGIKDLEEAIRIDPGRADTYSNLGAFKMAQGNQEEAEKAFKQAVAADPKSVPARLALANFYYSSARKELAEQELKACLELDPKNLLANRALALFAIASGKPADAEQYLRVMAEVSKTPETRIGLADYYASMKKYDDATRILKELASERATAVSARVRLATIEQVQGRTAQAKAYVDEALTTDPKNSEALVLRGRLQLAEGKADDALSTFQEAVRANPSDATAHFVLGQVFAGRQNMDEAAQAFQEVLKLNPRAVAAHFALATVLLGRGDAEGAIQHINETLQSQPDSPDARAVLVRALVLKGDLARAETELKPLVEKFPKAPTVANLQGLLQMARGDKSGAEKAFGKARTMDAKNFESLAGVVQLHLQAGRKTEAVAAIDAALAAEPTPRTGLRLLAAQTYAATGDLTRAEAILKKVIEADTSSIRAYGMLGTLYMRQRRIDDARREFEAVAARQPKSVPAHTFIGMAFDVQGKHEDAEKAYLKALEVDPRAAVAANNLAWMYADGDRNLDQALDLAKTARLALPDDPNVNDTLGWVYYKKKDYRQAITAFKASLAKEANRPDVLYHLGVSYAAFGDSTLAKESLQKALKLNPDFPGAADARKALASIGG